MIPDDLRWFQMIPDSFPRWSQMSLHELRWTQMSPDDPTDDPRCFFQMIPDEFRRAQMSLVYPRWSSMMPDDPRRSQGVPCDPKWCQVIPSLPRVLPLARCLPRWLLTAASSQMPFSKWQKICLGFTLHRVTVCNAMWGIRRHLRAFKKCIME